MNLDQKRDAIFCALALLIAGVIGSVSFGYPFEPSYFPRLLAIFLAALALLLLARVLRAPPPTTAETDLSEVRAQLIEFVKVIGAALLYIGLMRLTSYPVATVLFLLGMMWILGERSPKRLQLVGGLVTVALYFLFFKFLGVTPPEGLLAAG